MKAHLLVLNPVKDVIRYPSHMEGNKIKHNNYDTLKGCNMLAFIDKDGKCILNNSKEIKRQLDAAGYSYVECDSCGNTD